MFSNLSWPHSPFNLAKKTTWVFFICFSCPSGFFPFVFLCFSCLETRDKNLGFHKPTPPPRVKKLDVQDISRFFFKKKNIQSPKKKHDTTPTPNAAAFRPCKELMQATHLIPHLRFLKMAPAVPRKSPFWDYGGKCEPLIKPGLSGGNVPLMVGWGPLDFLWY